MALAKTKKKKLRKKLFSPKGLTKRKLRRESFSDLQLNNFKKLIKHDEEIFSKTPGALIIGFDEVGRGCLAGPVCTAGYSCSSFYTNADELLEEVTLSRQLLSEELLNTNIRDAYYSETLINSTTIEDNLEEVEELSALLSLEDSKKVIKAKRNALCRALLDVPCYSSENHILHHINFQSAKDVDKNGIVKNIWKSMTKNFVAILEQYLELYKETPTEVILLIDGPKTIPDLDASLRAQRGNPDISKIKITQIPIIKGDSKSSLIAAASNLAKLERDEYMNKLSEKTKYQNYIWAKNVGYGTKRHLEAIMEHGITDEHRKSFLTKYLDN